MGAGSELRRQIQNVTFVCEYSCIDAALTSTLSTCDTFYLLFLELRVFVDTSGINVSLKRVGFNILGLGYNLKKNLVVDLQIVTLQDPTLLTGLRGIKDSDLPPSKC